MEKNRKLQKHGIISYFDQRNLWVLGVVIILILIAPILYLGKGAVFPFHDQMDETILTYVFHARHLFSDFYPEMMTGVPSEAMIPSAYIFVPLYIFFTESTAFLLQYIIVLVIGYFGMYYLIRRMFNSSILGILLGTAFSMIPFLHIYGVSVMGIPMLILCMWNLGMDKKRVRSYIGIVLYSLGSNLVLTGYVLLAYFALFFLYQRKQKLCKSPKLYFSGIVVMVIFYLASNIDLIQSIFFKQSGFVSHRTEFLNQGYPMAEYLTDIFLNDKMLHSPTYHKWMVIPIVLAIILQGILLLAKKIPYDKVKIQQVIFFAICFLSTGFFYAFFSADFMAVWKNKQTNFWAYLNLNRFYWVLVIYWFVMFGWSLSTIWNLARRKNEVVGFLLLAIFVTPTILYIAGNSIFYMNVNQLNNGSKITGYYTWENLYVEDLMEEIKEYIGKEQSSYRVANLGICPVVSLMSGFYTIDGYSNNYPLEYKKQFRNIILDGLRNPEAKAYYDNWGSRCYLFNSEIGYYYLLKKQSGFRFEKLVLDTTLMKELGCEYLFSAAEIDNYQDLNLEYESTFTNDASYWEIWVYKIH